MSEWTSDSFDPHRVCVGIIGLGDMGALYMRKISSQGLRVVACDLPEAFEEMVKRYGDIPEVEIVRDGYAVARSADLLLFSVETSHIGHVVAKYAPAAKEGAVLGGQTSVKGPEIAALDEHSPRDTCIITCHSLHGPAVDPEGQTLVVTRHRASDEVYSRVMKVYTLLGSRIVELTWQEHDQVTADTQVVTHLGFLAMGTAWKNAHVYPWEDACYLGGIENVKILMALRIYSMKHHVYSGLALCNKHAKAQVRQYAASVSSLWRLMITEDEENFSQRVRQAGEKVFGHLARTSAPLLLPDDVLNEYALGAVPMQERRPNSHLSLLSMVDCWHQLGINPYDNLICQTPIFRLRLGIAEYLFKDKDLLEETINCALYNKEIRTHDMEFYAGVREWTTIITHGDDDAYRQQFEEARSFFVDRLDEARTRSTTLISKLCQVTAIQL